MDQIQKKVLSQLLWSFVPEDGASIGNGALGRRFLAAAEGKGLLVTELDFATFKEELIHGGRLVRGRGRGGSVKRAQGGEGEFRMAVQSAPEEAEKSNKRPVKSRKSKKKARKRRGEQTEVLSYRHQSKRKNNPEVGMVTPATDPDEGTTRWCYDPHIDPALQFDFGRAQVEKLIDDALAQGDEDTLRGTLEELKRYSAPYLNWSGKAEGTTFEVDTVSLHVHERIDPASILATVRQREFSVDELSVFSSGKHGNVLKTKNKKLRTPFQTNLFAAPFENLPLRDAIDFYKHEKGWSNRLIAGDSLQVMNSLIRKEGMAGRVQMIYIDPPYGIKYGSNFQPFVNKRDVKDRRDTDLTQEPEQIRAFRDTWELGIHSYLTYLRDRLLLARELLSESGSVFVQISDKNLHHVRELIDEVFGADNFIGLITFRTGSGFTARFIKTTSDYLLWYGKNKESTKYRQLFEMKIVGEGSYFNKAELRNGAIVDLSKVNDESEINIVSYVTFRPLVSGAYSESTTFDVELHARNYHPGSNRCWKTTHSGLKRLELASRIQFADRTLKFIAKSNDFPCQEITHVWDDTMELIGKDYAVQTTTKVVERCLLMTTDPGDLVLDPTCGSGTTAFVAEKWGRRWITCDTSRVAVTLAKQRLMTASYDYYALRYPHEGLRGGFIYKTVPHITLKAIANNPEIDEIYARMHPAIEDELAELNKAAKQNLKEWEVPFDFPDDWPDAAREPFDAFHAARRAMQRKMDDSIAAHAGQETLYDQPQVDRSKLRITGPFSVEAVPFPTVLSLEESEQPAEADAAIARSGESARQHQWRDELLKTGIRGKGGDTLRFAELETLPGTTYLHASGHLDSGERVVVSFGPEHAALEQRQVELALREAGELFPLPKMILYCAFTFDPEAAKDIDQLKGITALKAQMNTDLLTADLKKGRASNQSFWLMGQPDVDVRRREDGFYEVEVNGFDYFDTRSGELISGGKGKIAMWLLDTDYDERSLFPKQVFFPMAGKKEGWRKLKKNLRAELNEDLLEQFHGTVSLPFEAGENRKVAVKIVDDRGIESLKIITLGD